MAAVRLARCWDEAMSSIQEEILEDFYLKLAQADGFTAAKVKQVRELFEGSKKPKAVDLVKVFAETSQEGLP
jgi:hypothetical protein